MAGSSVKWVSLGKPLKYTGKKPFKGSKFKKVYRSKYSQHRNSVYKPFISKYPFPPTKLYHLQYAGDHVLTANAVDAGYLGNELVYRLNSMHDPDKTYAGHQPYGFDQLAAIYNRYKVVGVSIYITANDPTEDGMVLAYQFRNPSNTTETITNGSIEAVNEKQMTGLIRVNNTGSQLKTRVLHYGMHKLAGISKLMFKADPDNYTASVGGNPGNGIELGISCGSYRSTSPPSMMLNIKIVYHTLFFQRKVLPQS